MISCFCQAVAFLQLLKSVFFQTDSVDVDKTGYAKVKIKGQAKTQILEVDLRNLNLLVSTGLKFTRVSIDDSSSE